MAENVHAGSLAARYTLTMTEARNYGETRSPQDGETGGLLAVGSRDDQDYSNGGVGSRNDQDYFNSGGSGKQSHHDSSLEDLVVHSGLGAYDDQRATPRTPNRVRFDLTPEIVGVSDGPRQSMDDRFDLDDEDYEDEPTSRSSHRVPLLTNIEAPSVTVANSWGDADDAEDWAAQEMARPKSGLKSAFMNMANSIIGAGIIGQPYAIRQAGLLTGILLLIGLTIMVDWTVCLIVINSKLSGTSSFQGTVEYCFGHAGLIAISVAQWVFAFGGMVAFGVIVGDTIPHVLLAIWPGLPDIPVLGLLANRQVAIAVFVMGVSFPLTLYRDIAKVGSPV